MDKERDNKNFRKSETGRIGKRLRDKKQNQTEEKIDIEGKNSTKSGRLKVRKSRKETETVTNLGRHHLKRNKTLKKEITHDKEQD